MRSDYNPSSLLSLDTLEGEEEREREKFRLSELLDSSVLKPFLVTLGLMVLLQLSGHGSITFYAAHIFEVDSRHIKTHFVSSGSVKVYDLDLFCQIKL